MLSSITKLSREPVKLNMMFDIISHIQSKSHYSDTNDGEYPFIGTRSSHNNMIVKYVDYYDLDGDYICIGSVPPVVGLCTVHHGKFAVQHNVIVLKLKSKFNRLTDCLNCLAGNLTQYLHLKYVKCFRLTDDMMMNEMIPRIPFIQDDNDKHKMIIDTEGLKYAFNFWNEGNDSKCYNPSAVGMKEFTINELFNYYSKGKVNSLGKSSDGHYPCISCSAQNNGTAKYISMYDFDTNVIKTPLMTVPGDGDIYKCFVQSGKFSAQTSVHVLQPKYIEMYKCLTMIAYIMSLKFGDGTYEYHKGKLNKDRLMNESISLPVVVHNLSSAQEQQLANHSSTIEQLTNHFTDTSFTYELNENLMNWFCYKYFI